MNVLADLLLVREINPKVFTSEELRQRKRIGEHFLKNVLSKPRIFIIGDEDELGTMG